MRSVELHPRALDDLSFWIREDKRMALRIMELLAACIGDPFKGIGKPEPLETEPGGFRPGSRPSIASSIASRTTESW